MRVIISGAPGSEHGEIARALANRLSLNYISAKTFSTEYCTKYNLDYTEYSKHNVSTHDIDVYNSILTSSLVKDDFVLDAIVDINRFQNCTTIYIDREFTSEVAYPRNLFLQQRAEDRLRNNLSIPDTFMSKYNIVIDRTGLTNDYVVQFIVDLFISGSCGYFIPANLCLPIENIIPSTLPAILDESVSFEIGRYYCNYMLYTDVGQAILHCNNSKLLRVARNSVFGIADTQLQKISDYEDWFSMLGVDCSNAKLNLLLSKYCISINEKDYATIYTNLVQNGNPIRLLEELGFSE